MKSNIFKFNEEHCKLKSKLLSLSAISLFVGLSKSLPEKVAILGLDLSRNKTLLGWFILAVTFYFFIKFIVVSILEIIDYSLPDIIRKKIQNTTGNTIGLTADECYETFNYVDNEDIGTITGELKEIQINNERISGKYKQWFVKTNNIVVIAADFLFPLFLYATGTYILILLLIRHMPNT